MASATCRWTLEWEHPTLFGGGERNIEFGSNLGFFLDCFLDVEWILINYPKLVYSLAHNSLIEGTGGAVQPVLTKLVSMAHVPPIRPKPGWFGMAIKIVWKSSQNFDQLRHHWLLGSSVRRQMRSSCTTWKQATMQSVATMPKKAKKTMGHFAALFFQKKQQKQKWKTTWHQNVFFLTVWYFWLSVPGIHECSLEEQISWKQRSQIIEFAAVDVYSPATKKHTSDVSDGRFGGAQVLTGESICALVNWETQRTEKPRNTWVCWTLNTLFWPWRLWDALRGVALNKFRTRIQKSWTLTFGWKCSAAVSRFHVYMDH